MELPSAKCERVLANVADASSEQQAIDLLLRYSELTSNEAKRANADYSEAIERAKRKDAQILVDELLPQKYRETPGMSPALFARGYPRILQEPCVGIVGTRGASSYGKACAIKFSEVLSRAGVTILSGGAFGIDAAAHKGALDVKGNTVAVLPCGIDQSYPVSHKGLYESIAESGCLISQFACGFMPRHDSFLARNWTLAALSDAVLIIEAPEASGSIHTANRANEMGKPVYVVPGNIGQLSFRGSHELIRSGATLVDHPEQILEDLKIYTDPKQVSRDEMTEIQKKILAQLSSVPLAPEKIVSELAADPSEIMSELTMLELDGKIIRSAGGICLAP